MRGLKTALMVAAVLAVILAVGGFFLPARVSVARDIVIQAPPAGVFPWIEDLHRYRRWQPWTELDPETRFEFKGPAAGTGAKMYWFSGHPGVGTGSVEITESVAPRRVVLVVDYGDTGRAVQTLELAPVAEGTRVSWRFEMDVERDLVARYLGLLFDRWLGAEYEKGLTRLKALAEQPS